MGKTAYGKRNDCANSHLVRYLGYDYNPKEGKVGYMGSVKFENIKKWNDKNFKSFGEDYESKITDRYIETFRLAMCEVKERKEEIRRKNKASKKGIKIEEVIPSKE